MQAVLLKKKSALVPIDQAGSELLDRIKDGREVMVIVRQPRNPKHHRLYWAMVRFLREHVEIFENKTDKQISTAIKIGTGLGESYVDLNTGGVTFVPDSLSFAAMDQTQFAEFFGRACKLIANRWLPGNSPEEIRQELLAMIEPQGRAA